MAGKSDITPKTQKNKIILLTGRYDVGVSTVLTKLFNGGYEVIDSEFDEWSVYGVDPKSGSGWIWDEELMVSLLSEDHQDTLFISGTVLNQREFYPYFDAMVLLSTP